MKFSSDFSTSIEIEHISMSNEYIRSITNGKNLKIYVHLTQILRMSGSGNYAEECLNIQKPRDFKEISARAKRKESCEAQWECIKNRFLKWRESGAKK